MSPIDASGRPRLCVLVGGRKAAVDKVADVPVADRFEHRSHREKAACPRWTATGRDAATIAPLRLITLVSIERSIMKSESFDIPREPKEPPVPFDEFGVAVPDSTDEDAPARSITPSVSARDDAPRAEDAVYGGIFLTMACSALGWFLVYAREIADGLKVAGYFVGNSMVGWLHVLQLTS